MDSFVCCLFTNSSELCSIKKEEDILELPICNSLHSTLEI